MLCCYRLTPKGPPIMSKPRIEEIEESNKAKQQRETAGNLQHRSSVETPSTVTTSAQGVNTTGGVLPATLETPPTITDEEKAKAAESVFPRSAETSEQVRTALAAPSDGQDRAVAPAPLRTAGPATATYDEVVRFNTAIQAMSGLLSNPNVTNGTTITTSWKELAEAAWRAADAMLDAAPTTPKERRR